MEISSTIDHIFFTIYLFISFYKGKLLLNVFQAVKRYSRTMFYSYVYKTITINFSVVYKILMKRQMNLLAKQITHKTYIIPKSSRPVFSLQKSIQWILGHQVLSDKMKFNTVSLTLCVLYTNIVNVNELGIRESNLSMSNIHIRVLLVELENCIGTNSYLIALKFLFFLCVCLCVVCFIEVILNGGREETNQIHFAEILAE